VHHAPEPSKQVRLETAVFGFPVVKAPPADPVLAAEIGRFHLGLVLLQDPNDLLFRMSLALHRLVLSKGQTPIHSGSIQGGNVTHPTEVFPDTHDGMSHLSRWLGKEKASREHPPASAPMRING
jgi:hypothetical protein